APDELPGDRLDDSVVLRRLHGRADLAGLRTRQRGSSDPTPHIVYREDSMGLCYGVDGFVEKAGGEGVVGRLFVKDKHYDALLVVMEASLFASARSSSRVWPGMIVGRQGRRESMMMRVMGLPCIR